MLKSMSVLVSVARLIAIALAVRGQIRQRDQRQRSAQAERGEIDLLARR